MGSGRYGAYAGTGIEGFSANLAVGVAFSLSSRSLMDEGLRTILEAGVIADVLRCKVDEGIETGGGLADEVRLTVDDASRD